MDTNAGACPPPRIASRLHLAILLWVCLWTAFGGGRSMRRILSTTDLQSFHFRVAFCYVLIFIWEWVQLWYVWFGVRKTGTTLRTLIGGRWNSFGSCAKDFGLGFAVWLLWMVSVSILAYMMPTSVSGQHTQDLARALIPRTGLEISLWIPMSIAAGICEEVVFRGYLMRQLYDMSKSMPAAVIGQALIFGIVHSYQGISGIIIVFFMGLCLGCLAVWRRSLRPGMITHALYDGLLGLIMYLVLIHYQQH
jgi:membrane protease YdiL (CAAX protease family)